MAMILDKRTTPFALDVACDQAAKGEETNWNVLATPSLPGNRLRVPTIRFGTIEIEESLILTLPDGLIGFETCRRYVVVRHDENSPFRWLQSLDEPTVAFPVVEPGEFRPDYAPTISDSDARFLGLNIETPQLVFVIVTVPPHDPRALTANLLAPVVINGLTRQGKQVIIQDDGYTTRHSLVEELTRAATGMATQEPSTPAGPQTTKAARYKPARAA